MKTLKRIILAILILIVLIAGSIYFWLRSTAPDYSGTKTLAGLNNTAEVVYDDYGIPHVYAKNARDACFALGYAHAQDRLFQMVMIRRVIQGRLAEILGKELVNTDKYMLTLSINDAAKKSAERFMHEADQPVKDQVQAYLDGVNSFIENGTLPIEFTLMDFNPDPFTVQDVFGIIGYMSLTFTSAIVQDPLVYRIYQKYGDDYLKDLGVDSLSAANHYKPDKNTVLAGLFKNVNELQDMIPVPIWEGSNNWVVSKDHSTTGKPILCNDTHIKYAQPSVWYEAYIEYPGYNMYGYYLAGVPFPVVGHNNYYGWGVTIFPFDNMDLYAEKQNPGNPDQYWKIDHWENYTTVKKEIKVKGEDPVIYSLRSTYHGPLLNDVYPDASPGKDVPVSFWWGPLHLESTALEALYYINNASGMEEFKKGCSLIDVVGLNVLYGDTDGNIAWWASGRIPRHPSRSNSRMILDGASGKDDILGFYPFSKNPQIENPESGILNTSNDAPIRVDSILYPGYYSYGYRAARVRQLLTSKAKLNVEDMKKIQLDVYSDRDVRLANLIVKSITARSGDNEIVKALQNWDGNYDTASTGAVIYTQLLYFIIRDAMLDEVGNEDFSKLVSGTMMRNSIERLFTNDSSVWWDNVNTKTKETRTDIFNRAFSETSVALKNQLGDDLKQWKWGRVHQLIHVHPIGRKKPFDKYFNVGPFPMHGSNEVVDKEAFGYNENGIYPVKSGPALRFILDFANTGNALSVIPTGQSGNVMSPHYADQAELFVSGKYRHQIMKKDELKKGKVLKLEPED